MWEQKDTVRGSSPRAHRLHQKARLGAGANTAARPEACSPPTVVPAPNLAPSLAWPLTSCCEHHQLALIPRLIHGPSTLDLRRGTGHVCEHGSWV